MTDHILAARLDRLLSEPLESIRLRQRQTLLQVLGDFDQPFVLFGAGHLGRKAARALLELGLVPQAFIDNNPALWGTHVQGIEVLSPGQLASREADQLPAIITTIWCGEASDRMVERLAPLRELGFERIALFGHLAWYMPERFLPHYSLDLPEKVIGEAANIRRAFNLLADEESKQLFVDHVQWRLFLDYDLLPPASPREIYFNDHFVTAREDEVLYDIGAFNGDSIHGYIQSGRKHSQIHSFEPSAKNFADLQDTVAQLGGESRGLYAHALAVGDSVGEILIEAENGPASRVGSGSETVRMSTLDELGKQISAATFIKIDIEGFEPQCLEGGRQLISQQHPVLAVCVYHEQAHLWSILLQLHGYYDGYRFSLCPHLAEGWDLVLYAVPAERVALPSLNVQAV
ncbi:FkbM family methyltransferase [Pseudomonas sp. PH1b]|uniref:FkbM family methyltransferase n=1 Tax=Pseudomonas sp. PH1b TaxID=1397282 RepID=UPI00046B09B3|nr:FkbM family methyltransferase [Pseudomonas sp. PH1b]